MPTKGAGAFKMNGHTIVWGIRYFRDWFGDICIKIDGDRAWKVTGRATIPIPLLTVKRAAKKYLTEQHIAIEGIK